MITETYLQLLYDSASAEQTCRNNRRSFDLYREWLDANGINEITVSPADLQDYWRWLTIRFKLTSAAKHLIHLRAAYKHAHELGLIPTNPTSGLNKLLPKSADSLPETFTAEELRAMYAAIETDRENTMFHLLTLTGARAAELRALPWTMVDLDQGHVHVHGKGGKIRLVPLHPILRDHLESLRQHRFVIEARGQMMHHKTWDTAVGDLMTKAGVVTSRGKSHVFRKTLATNLLRQNVPGHVVDTIFGWAKTQVRDRHYAGVASVEMYEAIETAYRDDPILPGIEKREDAPMNEAQLLNLMELLQSQIAVLQTKKEIAA